MKYVPHGWGYANNYAFSNKGRIWIFWNTKVWNYNIINLSSQHITIEANNNGGLEIMVSFIYGENWKKQREHLWSQLKQIHQTIDNKPWT